MGDNIFGDGSGGPGVGPNLLDPLDLRKSGAAHAAEESARLQSGAAMSGIGEQRRQFDLTTSRLTPFFEAGLAQLPAVQGAATAEGLDERLAKIMGTDTFRALRGERERAVGSQLSQAGLLRSGAGLRAAAAIPTDLALALEEQLFGRQSSLLGSGQNAAARLGAFGADQADSVTELLRRSGDAWATNSIAQGQIAGQRTQGIVNAASTIASIYFSDPRLKKNMRAVGKIGPLTLFEWDWIEGVSKAVGKMSLGFDASEVLKHFPQHVVKAFGFLAIDYHALTDELREGLRHGC